MPSIMVIASNQAVYWLLQTILEDAQYTVNGKPLDQGTVSTVHATHPDLVLVEVGIGSAVLGWTMVERLRADAALQDLPVVVYSVDRYDLHNHAALLKTYHCHTLVLPATVEEIRAAVTEALAPPAAHVRQGVEYAAATLDR